MIYATTAERNWKLVASDEVTLAGDDTLTKPLRVRKPTMWFVNSMSDLFHESVPDEWIDRVFAVMLRAQRHTFQCLTKRQDRMRSYIRGLTAQEWWKARLRLEPDVEPRDARGLFPTWPLPNVRLGVSVEDQQRAEERIPALLDTPAAVRFVSAEPLLGPVDLTCIAHENENPTHYYHALDGYVVDGTQTETERIDWVIVGGESGPGARPMHPDWARSIRDQCAAAGVPFFFKQWGDWFPREQWEHNPDLLLPDDEYVASEKAPGVTRVGDSGPLHRVGKKRAGRLLDGVTHDAMPERKP